MRFLNIVLIVLLPFTLICQNLDISGYFENQFFPLLLDHKSDRQNITEKLFLQDYNKLRLDLNSEVTENVHFSGDIVLQTYHGVIQLNLLDFIPVKVADQYLNSLGFGPADWDIFYAALNMPNEDQYFLDNAHLTYYSKYLNIRIGKQQLPWGTGYTWNPTDIFNQKNMVDPTYEKPGVNALKIEIPYSMNGMLTAVGVFGEDAETSTKAFKLRQLVGGLEVSLSYMTKDEKYISSPFNPVIYKQNRQMVGFDFSGALGSIGIWGEFAYNYYMDMDYKNYDLLYSGVFEFPDNLRLFDRNDYQQYLLGADYTFENGLYFITEYYHNGLGKSAMTQYSFDNWLRLMGPDGENLGKEYFFIGQSYPFWELLNWSNYLIYNASDKSLIFFPWFTYSLNNETELIFSGYMPFGKELSEFGSFGSGGFLRLRYYF